MMRETTGLPHWLIVNGDFAKSGGQEFANHALATRLADSGRALTLIAHTVDAELAARPNVKAILVRRPLQSYFLGERQLERAAYHERLVSGPERSILVGNGGNCTHADVSWVHFVHAAWKGRGHGTPLPIRVFNWVKKRDALARERVAFANAALIVSNSERTTSDLERLVGVPRAKVARIWFGAEPISVRTPIAPVDRPTLLFIGALGWDERKGLDIALRTFAELVVDPAFRHTLVVAGGGSASRWKRLARALKISHRVEFLAFSTDVPSLLSRADLLLSPTRYESYGLAIQEAVMSGVPPIVGRGAAGVTDRFPSDLTDLIVEDLENHLSWADRVRYALANLQLLRAKTRATAVAMSQRTWRAFADEFIDVVESRLRSGTRQRSEEL